MAELRTGESPAAAPPAPRPTAPAAALPTPNPPGSLAPDPALSAPTPEAESSPPPAATPLRPLILPSPEPATNEQRWRAQQQERGVFPELLPYSTSGSELWWFDPVNQQHVILGRIAGEFVAQAQFLPRGQGLPALEVPYQVNVSYGLTALSPALLARIAAAGYESDWIETYIFLSPDVTPR